MRYEFLEFIVRCAIMKYSKNGRKVSEAEAVKILWEEALQPHFKEMELIDPFFYD